MIRYLTLLLALAISLVPLCEQSKASPDDSYQQNDLLLFLLNPTGTTGTDRVVLFSLGSTWNVFRKAATPNDPTLGSVISLGNINTILTSTYGADWTGLSSSLFLGAVGQNGSTSSLSSAVSNGDFARTVYVTKPRLGAGSVGVANSSAAAVNTGNSAGVAGAIAGANSIAGNTDVVTSNPVNLPNSGNEGAASLVSQNPFGPTGAPATAYTAIQGGVVGETTNAPYNLGSVSNVVNALDLYRVTPSTSGSTAWQNLNNISGVTAGQGYYLGTLTLSDNGDVNFVARQPDPAITLAGDDLTGMTTTQNVPSAHKSLTITATNLGTSNLSISLPPGFEVSTNGGASYATTGTIVPTSGGVTATVRVRIAATATLGNLGGDVSVSAGSKSETKPISGTVGAPAPSVAISGTFSGFTTTAGTPSAAQTFSVSGSNLTGTFLTVAAPSGFEVRSAGSGSYGPSTTISPVSGTVAATSMEIRIAAATPAGPLTGGVITVASTGATSATLSVSGTVNAPPPSLTVTPDSLNGLTATEGAASTPQTFTLSGANLTADVTVTAPPGFEVSNGGVNYDELLTLTPNDGALENTTVSVRISDSANSGAVTGAILIQSGTVEDRVSVTGFVGSSAAVVVVSNFSVFTTTVGTPSDVQTFTVSGANLSGGVIVAAPEGFELSQGGVDYGDTLELTPNAGSLLATLISVRIAAATPVGSPSGNITVSSSGAQKTIAVGGKVDPVPPALATAGTLAPFSTTEGTASSAQTFTVSGSNLTGNVTVTAPSGFEVSSNGTSFSSSLALTPSSGAVSASISVRVAAAAPSGSLSGNITVSTAGVTSKTVSVSATVTAMPRINVEGSLVPFSAISGTASAEQTLQLSGSNLTGNVTIAVPDRYEVSRGGGQPYTSSSLIITPVSGSIVNQSIFVRLAAAPVDNYAGDLGFSTPGASAIKVAVSGTVVPPPTVNGSASFVTFNATQGSASASQSFSVSGANLSAPVTVIPPTGFEVSLDNSSFGSTQTINPQNGAVASELFIRIAATAAVGSPSGTVRISSTGATERSLAVSGKVVPPPSLAIGGTLLPLSAKLGTASAGRIFTVSGTDLTGNVTVAAPTGFEVTGQRSPYAKSIVLTPSQGRLDVQVFVRISRTATIGNLSGSISATTNGAAPKQIAVQGSVSALPNLVLGGSLKAFNTTRGRPSASQSFTVAGRALNGMVSVTAPAGFQVSLNNRNFGARVQINPVNQVVASTRIWIRLAAGSKSRVMSGNVTASSNGASTKIIRISGRIR